MTDTKNKRAHLISLGKLDVPTDGTWRDRFGLFKLWIDDSPEGVLPQIVAARCLGISYGDPGPKLDEKACRECWGDRKVWLGNVWGLQHQNDTRTLECKHQCHDDEVWYAEGRGMSAYMVRLIFPVCKAIGCKEQATYSVWDDNTQPRELAHHAGDYCSAHGFELVRALTEAKGG